MRFYDNYNFDGLKLLTNIKDKPEDCCSEPCGEILSVIKHLKTTSPRNISVAEIGIGYGATALQVLKTLGVGDVYYAFDFAEVLNDFAHDLQARDFGINCEVVLAPNTDNLWDSYNWNLSNMIFKMRERNEAGMFDAVYLDGAHTFLHDGLAVCLLKELIKDGGFLILDDVFWTFMFTKWRQGYGVGKLTDEQMNDYQVWRARKLFLDNDPNFEALTPPNAYRAVFRKHVTK
ncbi:MAG: class I SAM-dependent methyltransferase [Selenomonadaceae bacterium]|nr:class I SAM-dependent methyltransferase [Selenomonadaceae bacterium]